MGLETDTSSLLPYTAIGVGMVALTVGMHAVGTIGWIGYLRSRRQSLNLTRGASLRVLITTALILMTIHIVQVLAWALVYGLLGSEEIESAEEAVYFSVVVFTSLGFGDITLSSPERLLSGIEAMNGLLLFGWSTALLYSVVQYIWGALHVTPDSESAA